MNIDPNTSDPRDLYFAMIHAISPRPIAWVSTVNKAGMSNLAPFSFFTGITSRPPTLLFCPGFKLDGTPKDTLANIQATKEFVVNVVPHVLVEAMNATSGDFEAGVSEFERCGIEASPSERVKPLRVAASPVHIECTLYDIINVGNGNIVIGEIQLINVADDALDAKGAIDPAKLDLVGRMGGLGYCKTSDRFEVQRPKA